MRIDIIAFFVILGGNAFIILIISNDNRFKICVGIFHQIEEVFLLVSCELFLWMDVELCQSILFALITITMCFFSPLVG